MQAAAAAGKPTGGPRAFGYESDGLRVRPDEAKHLRAAYASLVAGGSLGGIAAELNRNGVRTIFGNTWSPTPLRGVLKNPRYAGLRAYKGDIIGAAVWPAIVDRDTFDAAQAILALPQRRASKVPRARRFLLPNLARCGVCGGPVGGPVRTGRTHRGVRTYRCERWHLARAADPVDDYVVAVVLERLSRPDAVDLLQATGPDLAVYRERSQAIRERLDALAVALEEGILSLGAVRKSSERLRASLAESEAELAALSRGDVLAPLVNAVDHSAVWEALDLDRKRSIIDVLMTVTLDSPGRGRHAFDPSTVRIAWKSS
jgi:site-specific DNA recombinase